MEEILSVVRQNFWNTVYSHKIQEIAAERKFGYSHTVKVINIVIVGLVLWFLILSIANEQNKLRSYLSLTMSVAEVVFLILQLSLNFDAIWGQHKKTALQLRSVRELYISLIWDILSNNWTIESWSKYRDSLQERLDLIYESALETTRKDFETAQQRLNPKWIVYWEDFTFSDEEIDRFLPSKLRLNKQ